LGKHPCISIGSKIGDVDSIPRSSLLNRDSDYRFCVLLSAERSLFIVSCVRLCPRSSVQSLRFPLGRKVQSLSKTRPPSLCHPARERRISPRTEILRSRSG